MQNQITLKWKSGEKLKQRWKRVLPILRVGELKKRTGGGREGGGVWNSLSA